MEDSILVPKSFIETPSLAEIHERAIAYLNAGLPVHFSGPSGVGKTSLALHVAHALGRPIVLLVGDAQMTTSDMIDQRSGYRFKRVVDNYVRSVLKTQESFEEQWVYGKLTAACKNGFTLVYDEFTRSRPDANNVLLSVLEEGVLLVPGRGDKDGVIRVSPEFRAIFTSNPKEYSGTYRSSDALLDRMITIRMSHYDFPTEVLITNMVCGVTGAAAEWIARLVHLSRESFVPTASTRACIGIGKIMKSAGLIPDPRDKSLSALCWEIITSSLGECLPEYVTAFNRLWEESFALPSRAGKEMT